MTTLREAAKNALKLIRAQQEWIQAVPDSAPLPTMPGYDGDWASVVTATLRQAIASTEAQPVEPDALGCKCSVCGAWQKWTSSGMTCKNGHGGALGINHKLFTHPASAEPTIKQNLTVAQPDVTRISEGDIAQPESEPNKDTAAVMEIDKVMLHAAQHWPDVDSEAMVVRHVKFLTRMLNTEVEAHRTLITAVAKLRRAVRAGRLTGVEDWKRLYDPELLALLGCKHFQDLYDDPPDPIEKEHVTDGSPCWCYPEVNYTDPATGASVIIHKDPQ